MSSLKQQLYKSEGSLKNTVIFCMFMFERSWRSFVGRLPLEVSDMVTSCCYSHGQVCYTFAFNRMCVHIVTVHSLDSKGIVGMGLVLDGNL